SPTEYTYDAGRRAFRSFRGSTLFSAVSWADARAGPPAIAQRRQRRERARNKVSGQNDLGSGGPWRIMVRSSFRSHASWQSRRPAPPPPARAREGDLHGRIKPAS